MRVSIFGTGYVGLVTGTCLAEVGHEVTCVDVDQSKVDGLNQGKIPIYEPGLEALVLKNHKQGRLRFTTNAADAVAFAEVQFIAVGTPPDEDGSADLQYVLAVAKTIAEHMDSFKVVIDKSTVPVGTADKVSAAMAEVLQARGESIAYEVCSNPEFLKEGAAVTDFMKPDRIVVGTGSDKVQGIMRELYAPFNRNHDRILFMDVRSAELTKYAANAMLATKISFMNEMANLAEHVGADIEAVRHGIGSDPRIGYQFIYPGCGYGGSCFPKDVQALARTAGQAGYNAQLLNAVEVVNDNQKTRLFAKLSEHYQANLAGKIIAIWGLSFKPNTDDMREAPSRVLMEALWAAGASVRAFDPVAREETQRIYGDRADLILCDEQNQVLDGADALVVCTEWSNFKSPDFGMLASKLTDQLIVDGRNIFDPKVVSRYGLTYRGIGRSN